MTGLAMSRSTARSGRAAPPVAACKRMRKIMRSSSWGCSRISSEEGDVGRNVKTSNPGEREVSGTLLGIGLGFGKNGAGWGVLALGRERTNRDLFLGTLGGEECRAL